MQLAICCIGTFAAINRFICEEVDLSGNSLTVYTENIAFSWSWKEYWFRLQRVRRVVDLLRKVKKVMRFELAGMLECGVGEEKMSLAVK